MSDDPEFRDLPTLEGFGETLRDATERAESQTDRWRRPIRRMTLAVAVMLLAVPGAVATRSIWTEPVDRFDPANGTSAVVLAEGRSGPVRWQLSAYDRTDGLECVQLQTGVGDGRLGEGCTRPVGGPAKLVVGTASGSGVGFVYGTVSAEARSVSVTVGGGRAARAAAVAPDPDVLRRAGLSARRVFVVTFQEGVDVRQAPAFVVEDGQGRVIGRAP